MKITTKLTPFVELVIVNKAQNEAFRFNSNELLPEHVMLALLRAKDKEIEGTLAGFSIDFKRLIFHIENNLHNDDNISVFTPVTISNRMVNILNDLVNHCRNAKRRFIEGSDLFIQIALEKGSIVEGFFKNNHIDPRLLRKKEKNVSAHPSLTPQEIDRVVSADDGNRPFFFF